MGLLDLDTVSSRLRSSIRATAASTRSRSSASSLDHNTDFDRDLRPRLRGSQERLASLRAAFPEGGAPFPPIEVHELGRANFVVDGQHRVALARERGAEYVDAEVTRLVTNYEVPPDVDVCELIHTEQQRIFGEQSDLAEARRRRSLRVLEASADFAAAAEDASRARVSRRFRRKFVREQSHPVQTHRVDRAE
jgi:hypothetical protein